MGTTNVENGKAFEFACLIELENLVYNNNGNPVIIIDKRYSDARAAFDRQPKSSIQNMRLAARAGMQYIMGCEPRLRFGHGLPVRLSLQEDKKGQDGDVRDVLCVRAELGWEIGISCKHNHEAVKHSRLSPTIDFGNIWLSSPCSPEYFRTINPIFDELAELQAKGALWRDIPEKSARIYKPVLQAFVNEIKHIDDQNPNLVASNLVRYLLGRRSFYKVMSHDRERTTSIQAFDFEQNLNQPGTDDRNRLVKPQLHTKSVSLPKRMLSIGFRQGSNSTIEIQCEDGWVLSFRIHNASSFVEPSLKFDVQLEASPIRAQPVVLPWGKWSDLSTTSSCNETMLLTAAER